MLLGLLLALTACGERGLPLLSGETLPARNDAGRWLLINYWATWCGPCRTEVPELNQLHRAPDIRVLGVNFDRLEGEALRQAAAELGIEFDVALEDPRAFWPHELPQVLPATLLVSPAGEVRAALLGPQTETSLRDALARAANGQ